MQTISIEVDVYLFFLPGYPADLEEAPTYQEEYLSQKKS